MAQFARQALSFAGINALGPESVNPKHRNDQIGGLYEARHGWSIAANGQGRSSKQATTSRRLIGHHLICRKRPHEGLAVLWPGLQPVVVARNRQDHHHALLVAGFLNEPHQRVIVRVDRQCGTRPNRPFKAPRSGTASSPASA